MLMKFKIDIVLASVVVILGVLVLGSQFVNQYLPVNYPKSRTVEQVDVYHGVSVKDPYRWLENINSNETREWIKEQNKVTDSYLEKIKVRDLIRQRLKNLWNYSKHSVPYKLKDKLFYFKNNGKQDRAVFYVKRDDSEHEEVLLDPNNFSEDGTISLAGIAVSDDAKYLAYGKSKAGSDWEDWYVRGIDSKIDLKDNLHWIKFSGISWKIDGSGFFYSRYDKPRKGSKYKSRNYNQKLYFHKLGTDQSKDQLVYERKDKKEWGFTGTVTEDGRYLIINVWKGTEDKNRVFYKDLQSNNSKVVELLKKADASYGFIKNIGTKFYFFSDLNAPKGKVISFDLNDFNKEGPKFFEVVPESDDTLVAASMVGNQLFLRYLKDAHASILQYSLDGKLVKEVKLPGMGTVIGFGGKKNYESTYYGFASFASPMEVHKYEIESGVDTVVFKPKVKFDPNDFVTKQVFVSSKDGVKVPLFICHKKGIELNGKNPTLLDGYGGFNISRVPVFSLKVVAWMEMGGVYAQACLRGGGEYGDEWHKAGIKKKKQNVFDDFISCSQWLIDKGYTEKDKLAITGESNGGLLVGACMTQRPELFAAACPAVGVMDMLRFHKYTIGWGWVSDYGSAENEDEFKALYAYSPLHNIKEGTDYPSTFITTADHDDRVIPAHSFKFAAALQNAQTGLNPILIRIETAAGHGDGRATFKTINETADKFAFLAKVLKFEKIASSNLEKTIAK